MKLQQRGMVCAGLSGVVLLSGSAWQAQAGPKEAKQVLETYVTVVAKVYPPAGGVFGAMLKMLDFTGYFGKSPDPVGEALKAINTRLDAHEQQINKLSTDLNELRQGQYGERNWNRFTRLQDSRNDLQTIAETLAEKPTDKSAKTRLVGEARAVAARFLDMEMWTWSDQSLKDQAWTNRQDERRSFKAGEMTEPDFKSMPTLEFYTTALVVWSATIEHAAGGDAAAIQAQYGGELQKHIAFLTRRPGWKEISGEPESLPEHVADRVRGFYEPEKYPRDGACHVWQYIRDDMRRNVEFADETITYPVFDRNVLCNVPATRQNRAPQIERDREREYGLPVMANLAALLTNLRDKGTVRGAVTAPKPIIPSQTGDPSLPRPSPSSPKVEPGGRHKALLEENGFATGGGQFEENILYGVAQDGQLIWHRHWIEQSGGGVRHKFAPTRRVGDGWKAGYQGAYPGGDRAIYTLDDNGGLRWHWHIGAFDGSYQWSEPAREVGTGWSKLQIVPMDNGVVYTIPKTGVQGTLRWHRHLNYRDGQGGVGGWAQAQDVHQSFNQYLTVFSGGEGVLYAVSLDGRLFWYRHNDYLNPALSPRNFPPNLRPADAARLTVQWTQSWQGPKRVGTGWNGFTKIFSPGGGHIYAVLPNGDLMYYRHRGYLDGSYNWDENIKGKIAEGWNGYGSAFARIITSDRFVGPK